jgi:hypothetical protein
MNHLWRTASGLLTGAELSEPGKAAKIPTHPTLCQGRAREIYQNSLRDPMVLRGPAALGLKAEVHLGGIPTAETQSRP